jgi:membrane protein implicated in regulation of membrane protease activity
MTIEHSPLKKFDPMVAHMMFQVLALVWSGIFAAMIGSYIAFGISAAFHIFLISGVLVTVLVFREGNKRNVLAGYNGRALGGEHE